MATQRPDRGKKAPSKQVPEGETAAARKATNAPGYVQPSAHPPSPRKYLINAGVDSQLADNSHTLLPKNLGSQTGGRPVQPQGGDARSTFVGKHLFEGGGRDGSDFSD
jgi:hypothetical protein